MVDIFLVLLIFAHQACAIAGDTACEMVFRFPNFKSPVGPSTVCPTGLVLKLAKLGLEDTLKLGRSGDHSRRPGDQSWGFQGPFHQL